MSRIFLILMTSVLALSCTKKAAEEQMVQKISDDTLKLSVDAIKNIKLAKVQKGDFPDKLSLMGRISVPEDRVAVVPSRVTGRIDSVFVSSGEMVTPGQSLASISSPDFAIAHEEYYQALKQVKANPDDAEAKHLLELTKKKIKNIGGSVADVEKGGSSSEGPKSENLIVRAPRAGALIGKNAMIGNVVNVGDTLFMIGDMDKVWFAGDIYPEDLGKVHKDQEVEIAPGNGVGALHGKISFISPVIDPNTRTIKIRALMDNPGGQLRADMYVQGDVILSRRTALIMPKSAIVRLHDSVFCFKRGADNQFKKIFVKVDSEAGDMAAVSEGLADGDEVVTEGALLLDAALSGSGEGAD